MRVCLLFLWGLVAASIGGAATLSENFSANPLQNGWEIFGDTNLFHWDALNQNLAVTWDSSQTNSYFYHPLGTILARDDDFSLLFDLRLNDVETTGYGFEITVSLLGITSATSTNFDRGAGINPAKGARNVVEFDYFPAPDDGTISPTIISSNNQFATVFDYPLQLTNGVLFHIAMTYHGHQSNSHDFDHVWKQPAVGTDRRCATQLELFRLPDSIPLPSAVTTAQAILTTPLWRTAWWTILLSPFRRHRFKTLPAISSIRSGRCNS